MHSPQAMVHFMAVALQIGVSCWNANYQCCLVVIIVVALYRGVPCFAKNACSRRPPAVPTDGTCASTGCCSRWIVQIPYHWSVYGMCFDIYMTLLCLGSVQNSMVGFVQDMYRWALTILCLAQGAFLFAYVWSIGASVSKAGWQAFNDLVHELLDVSFHCVMYMCIKLCARPGWLTEYCHRDSVWRCGGDLLVFILLWW